MKKIYFALTVVAACACIAVGFLGARLLAKKDTVTVSAESIEERLEKCSSLTTARLDYRGIIKYEEGDIPLINKKSFSMIYDAHIRAGIDLSKASVQVNGKTVSVTLPKASVQDVTVDADSLEFYDERFALFNWTDKEDTQKAMEYAKQDAQAKAGQTDILEQAASQAKTVIETLVAPITEEADDEWQLVFKESE